MKVKLCDGIIDTSNIKQLHRKRQTLWCGYGKFERTHYAIEYLDGNYRVINKQEYKMIKKVMKNEKII